VTVTALARNPLFEGLEPAELEELNWRMQPRRFAANEAICREGEPGDSLFVIADGLARVIVSDPSGDRRAVARLRRGDVIGEMSLLTGEPRSATVVAGTPTTALELGQRDFAALLADHPRILANLARILSRRLAETTTQVADRRARGEAIALLVGPASARLVPALVAAAEAASPRPVASLDARLSIEQALDSLDDMLAEHGTAILVADLGADTLGALVDGVDRAVAVIGSEAELAALAGRLAASPQSDGRVEAVVVAEDEDERRRLSEAVGARLPVVRAAATPLPPADAGWIGRHLARAKLGLALGAGGAKGYAHVGVLQVLEAAGFTVDCVAGSSIGAIAGTWLALGMDSAEVERTMRHAFRPEVVAEIFKLSLSGGSTGVEAMTKVLRETTRDATFDDILLPLAIMTVDLNAREPAPMLSGPLWEALLAATSVAGLFPPYETEGQRLVDGLALVPVPVDAVVGLGADVVVSVNLISRDVLPAWPGEAPPEPEEPKGARTRMLDTLLEVMDVAQLDSSERHAARADVVVTPRFGPGSWRDFHLADLFLEAGRQAAEEQLPALQALARPRP
jgi:predicted acylesterase/phospholipase RssA/CRP-like cAMP-binding protein